MFTLQLLTDSRSIWRTATKNSNAGSDGPKGTLSKDKTILERGPMPNVMAALPNIGGALFESSVIPFLVGLQRRKVRMAPLLERRAVTLPV